MSTQPRVRPARAADAAALAALTSQLGYPVDEAEQAGRLASVLARPADDVVLVAVDADDRPLGWIHVTVLRVLELSAAAQVMGLVVAEGRRSAGIGATLLAAGEAWASSRGCRSIELTSRETRTDAHRFYEREGYRRYKVSHRFRKPLLAPERRPGPKGSEEPGAPSV